MQQTANVKKKCYQLQLLHPRQTFFLFFLGLLCVNEMSDRPPHYPLLDTWNLFLDDGNFTKCLNSADYERRMSKLGSFSSVQMFWRYLTALQQLLGRHLEVARCNVRMFKEFIKPVWEDEYNRTGGKWVVFCDRDSILARKVWLEILLAVVGGTFPLASSVCGCVFSCKRRKVEVQLWVSREFGQHKQDIQSLVRAKIKLSYQAHFQSVDSSVPTNPDVVAPPPAVTVCGDLFTSAMHLPLLSASQFDQTQQFSNSDEWVGEFLYHHLRPDFPNLCVSFLLFLFRLFNYVSTHARIVVPLLFYLPYQVFLLYRGN